VDLLETLVRRGLEGHRCCVGLCFLAEGARAGGHCVGKVGGGGNDEAGDGGRGLDE